MKSTPGQIYSQLTILSSPVSQNYLIKVIQFHIRHISGHDEDFDSSIFHEHFDESFRTEGVIEEKSFLLVRSGNKFRFLFSEFRLL